MNDLQDMSNKLVIIAAAVSATVAILTGILKILGILSRVWKKIKPGAKYLASPATQVVPIGMIVWYFMYRAAENSGRLTEPVVFLLLVAELTILISLYELLWGVWFYPRLKSLFEKRTQNGSPPPVNKSIKRRQQAKH